MYHQYIAYIGRNSPCLYKDNKEMISYEYKNTTITRPCQSWSCPKHTHIPRRRLGDVLVPAIEDAAYAYVVQLPIGPLLEQHELQPLWKSWRQGLEYECRNQTHQYCFIKELQHNNFHLHGVVLSNSSIHETTMRKSWCKFLKKHMKMEKPVKTVQFELIRDPVAVARYITKDLTDTRGAQAIPKGWFKKSYYSSQHFGEVNLDDFSWEE